MTFDFTTLYTKIPHRKLTSALDSLIDFCFDGGDKKYIGVDKFGAKWTANPDKFPVAFDKKH